jgi:hypothetical protein
MKLLRWLLLGTALAGCTPLPPVIVVANDGFEHQPFSGTFDCDGKPTALIGNRRTVTLEHGCRRIWVAGSNNDVIVYVEPGASIEVSGNRNSIVYRLIRRGPAPKWIDSGLRNELMRNSTASWERDHDWYQEQHDYQEKH